MLQEYTISKAGSKEEQDNEIDIEEHIGLVRLCAKRFSGRGIEYDDVFQAGCLGLIKAAGNFDPDMGNKFSTYAVPVILGEIRALFREGMAIKVSRGVRDLARRANEESEKIIEETGSTPSLSVLAERLGISIEKTAMALGALKTPMSLTVGDEEMELEIPVEAPEAKMTDRMTLYQIMETLPDKDRKLLQYRYYQNKTQQQTADLLNMTQVQVSRREKKLLLHMRTLM